MKRLFIQLLTICIVCTAPGIWYGCSAEPADNTGDEEQPETVPEDCDTYGYILDTGGNPVPDVVVTDGYTCVLTDGDGMYSFYRNSEADFVSYSIPSQCEVGMSEKGIPSFYSRLEEGKYRYDFTVTMMDAPESRFNLLAIGDPQITENAHAARFKDETAADIRQYAAGSGVPCYGIILGDFVGNKWELYSNIFNATGEEQLGIPAFACIGNHDHEYPADNDRAARAKYESWYGPSNYSFNRGDAHIIVMDDIMHGCKTSSEYDAGFTTAQFEWLKQDLSYVDKDRMVILCVHIPFRGGSESGGSNVNKDKYYNEVLEMLSGYETSTIMSAHTHSNINYIHTAGGKEIFEHITGTTCGAWWKSTVCTEGTPIGFGIYEINGNRMEDWKFKAVRHDENFQIRLYRGSDVFTGGDTGRKQFDKNGENQIVANIWNWDPKWKVEVYENGTLSGEMTPYRDTDAWATAYHIDVMGLGSNYNKNTDHLLYFDLKDPSAEVKVVATDRFGNIYEQSVFTDPDSNPGRFHENY